MPHQDSPTNFNVHFVGMEPKRQYQRLHDESSSDQFSREIKFSDTPDNGAEQGALVGPLFHRIARSARIDPKLVDSFFDFSAKVVSDGTGKDMRKGSRKSRRNAQKRKGPRKSKGVATRVRRGQRDFFTRGARTSRAHMRKGPCIFVTISRNFASWVEHDCPGPDLNDSPAWGSWNGISVGTRKHLLTSSKAVPLGNALVERFSKFGNEHVMTLLPNPCILQ